MALRLRLRLFVFPALVVCFSITCQGPQPAGDPVWTFVSMPDFLNVDCDFPQPGWEETLALVLQSVKNENPEFLVVAGDLVMGHWDAPEWNDKDTIQKYSTRYYTCLEAADGISWYSVLYFNRGS